MRPLRSNAGRLRPASRRLERSEADQRGDQSCPSGRSAESAVERIGHRGAPSGNSRKTRFRPSGAPSSAAPTPSSSTSTRPPTASSSFTMTRPWVGVWQAPWRRADCRARLASDPHGRAATMASAFRRWPRSWRSCRRGARAYVEIKGAGHRRRGRGVVAAAGCDCAVHSFDHAAVARMREIAPDIPRGILYDDRSIDVVAAMRRTGARDVWPEWRLVDRATVKRVHDAGGRVIAWTVNSRAAAPSSSTRRRRSVHRRRAVARRRVSQPRRAGRIGWRSRRPWS